MQRLDLDLFYRLGSALRALHEVNRENMQRSWVYPYFDNAKDVLELVMLDMPFRTCRAAAENFDAVGRAIFADFYRKGGDPPDSMTA